MHFYRLSLVIALCLYCQGIFAVDYTPPILIKDAWARPYRIDSGVVELVFNVDKTGKPSDISVVRSTLSDFEDLAIRTISKYSYTPATLNAKTVDSRMTARIVHDHSRLAGISGFTNPMDAPEGFMSFYNKLRKELDKESPNQRKAKHTLKKLRSLRYKTFFTGVHTELAQYRYSTVFKEELERLEALKSIMMYEDIEWNGNQTLVGEVKLTIQLGLLKTLLDLGHYAEFLERYESYSYQSEIVRTFSQYVREVKAIRDSSSVLERKVIVTRRGNGFLKLLKPSFVAELVEGSINKLTVRCDAQLAKFDYKPNTQYQLPKSWGKCELEITGTPGSIVGVLLK